jgi:hypothetical protein
MLDFLKLFLHVLAAPFRTQAQLEAEVTLLRHQLNVLRRQAPARPRLTAANSDNVGPRPSGPVKPINDRSA